MDPPLSPDSPSHSAQLQPSPVLPVVTVQHVSPTPGLQHLRLVCGQLYFPVLAKILALGLYHSISRTDVLRFSLYGVETWGFSNVDTWVLWGSAIRLARFYHAAAHGIDLTSTITEFIPIHLPIAALRELGLTMPSLSFTFVRLIRPWFTHVGVLQGPTQIAAALYPIEHTLSGPMDIVMSTGVEKMEEDFEAVRGHNRLLAN
ncbi:hypothetical protein C8R46DRAFT_1039993 [Mycena filopes]|nr:hypothetical protein C8R46DRAFT_1039993 [Mycena filopes]